MEIKQFAFFWRLYRLLGDIPQILKNIFFVDKICFWWLFQVNLSISKGKKSPQGDWDDAAGLEPLAAGAKNNNKNTTTPPKKISWKYKGVGFHRLEIKKKWKRIILFESSFFCTNSKITLNLSNFRPKDWPSA